MSTDVDGQRQALVREERRAAALYCLRVFVVVRIALFVLGTLAIGLLPQGDRGAGAGGAGAAPPDAGWGNIGIAWDRADALWFLRIAIDGYRADDLSGAFFPLYPALVRVGELVVRSPLLAAYLVSNLALLVGLVLLYRLTDLELGRVAARRAVLYLCLFPTGFFLFAPYSESLFLATSVGAIYAARRGSWFASAGCAFLAALTRSPGALLAVPLLVEGVLQLRSRSLRPRALLWPMVASAAALAGTAAYLGYWQIAHGDWSRPLDLQRIGWSREPTWPWDALVSGVRAGLGDPSTFPGGYYFVDAVLTMLVLAATVWALARLRPTYGAYSAVFFVAPLLLSWPGRPLLSLPRIYVVLFPVVWALARFAERWRAHDLVVAACAAGCAVLGALFVSSYPIF